MLKKSTFTLRPENARKQRSLSHNTGFQMFKARILFSNIHVPRTYPTSLFFVHLGITDAM